jgi:hypothetical protein
MRLTLRLLTLAVLLSLAGFTNLVSPVSKADESTCTDGCDNQYQECLRRCGSPCSPDGHLACDIQSDKCVKNCRPGIE